MDTLKLFFTILIPLLIILDPLGNLPLFMLFTRENTPQEQDKMAAVASLSAAGILILFAVTGDYILRFFGITLPAFQLAGGFIFFLYALQMLQLIPSTMKATDREEKEGIAKDNIAFVPMATPLLAGPGAITAVLVWHQANNDYLHLMLLFLAIAFACLIVYEVFHYGKHIRNFLGMTGILVMSRLMGLLLAVIAVQFMVSGFQQL